MVNLFIVYESDTRARYLSRKFKLGDCLFGVMKLTKKADPDKYGYSGYNIVFDARSNFSTNGEWGRNVIIFSVNNTLCVLIIKSW